MAQQINLYNPALRRQREWLSFANVVAVAAFFALTLGAVGFTYQAQTRARLDAIQALEPRLNAARTAVVQLGVQAAANADGGAAERALTDQKQQLAMRREVLAALQDGAGIDSLRGQATVGFSDYLRGLARQTVQGLWLTGFAVGPGGNGLEVRGRMLVVDRLPEYIKRLNAEAIFKGRQFVSLDISRPEKTGGAAVGTPYAAFVLTSAAATVAAKGKEAGK